MQKVLVTGGAGFIGSHLCDLLIEKGYEVTCVDNLVTGSKKNIEHLLADSNFKFIEADVIDDLDFDIDYIFHLASPASPVDFEKLSEEILTTNSIGTLRMLKLAKKTKAKFLLASTSEVYGDPLEHPQKETYFGNVNSFGRRSCYDEGKRFAEAASYIYLKKHGVNLRIVRIFNTYGPRMRVDDGRVIITFVIQALRGQPFTIYGDGTQTRPPCFVSDMVEGIYKAMFSENTRGEIFNIGNPNEYSVIDLAKKIAEIMEVEAKFDYKPLSQNDPQRRCPDITKAKKILNWEPKVSLEEGLRKTIEYYRNFKS